MIILLDNPEYVDNDEKKTWESNKESRFNLLFLAVVNLPDANDWVDSFIFIN